MHIDSIQIFRVPLRAVTSDVAAQRFESVFVVMQSGDSFGNGETTLARGPLDCEEWSAGTFACLRDWMAPELVGRSLTSGEKLQEFLRPFQGNHHAKAALDIAWWNLAASTQEKPLYQLLGGTVAVIPLSSTLGVRGSTEELLGEIGTAFERGCDHLTLKFRPGWDLEMVRAVRQAFSAEPIAIDCDGLCRLGQQEIFYRLEDFFSNTSSNRCQPTTWSAMRCCSNRFARPSRLTRASRRSSASNRRSTYKAADKCELTWARWGASRRRSRFKRLAKRPRSPVRWVVVLNTGLRPSRRRHWQLCVSRHYPIKRFRGLLNRGCAVTIRHSKKSTRQENLRSDCPTFPIQAVSSIPKFSLTPPSSKPRFASARVFRRYPHCVCEPGIPKCVTSRASPGDSSVGLLFETKTMIYVVATIELVEGMREKFLAEQRNLLPLVRAEEGCVEYVPTAEVPLVDPPNTPARTNSVVMHEKWKTLANLQAHAVAPHMKEFRAKTKQMVVGTKVEVFQPV
ncbi:MAG: antibiotic biosynthesis monooxygenase [Planctomycetia bacterium]|nr:antibiotic biosynthesis monooxygenase [Planctomycetia bacterium]